MKRVLLMLLLGIGGWVGCRPTDQANERQALFTVLTRYFRGVEQTDLDTLNAYATADFRLFENGKVWTNDSLWHELQKYQDTRIKFRMDTLRISVDQNIGHIAYFNHGDVYKNGTLIQTINWMEDAAFRKEKGQWKIYFLHSSLQAGN
ncbi:MAG: hypothetical protein GXC72_06345 [Chitinophagaceae bacterium]|nr:hypothetical protein [Chitinophagaceae bacterium]